MVAMLLMYLISGNVFMSFEKTSEACLALENMDGQQIYNSPRILKVCIIRYKVKE